MAKSMLLGKPVIATDYSGNLDFMNVNNSFLVRYELAEIDRDYGPYRAGGVWADPDIGHAAELMRWVFENRGAASRIAGRAAEDIEKSMNRVTAGREMRERLERIWASRCF
jgi:hypothetical protein